LFQHEQREKALINTNDTVQLTASKAKQSKATGKADENEIRFGHQVQTISSQHERKRFTFKSSSLSTNSYLQFGMQVPGR